MSLIEGIGDEVTALVGIFFLLVLIFLAWLSTNIRDIPFISVIIVELTTRARRNRQQQRSNDATQQATTESDNHEGEVTDDDSSRESTPSENEGSEAQITSDRETSLENDGQSVDVSSDVNSQNGSVQSEPRVVTQTDSGRETPEDTVEALTANELRQRRVAFFKNNGSEKSEKILSAQATNESVCNSGVAEPSSGIEASKETNSKDTAGNDVTQTSNERVQAGESDTQVVSETPSSHGNQGSESGNQSEDGSQQSQIRIKLKYLNETQRQVEALPTETIGNFRRAHFQEELSANKLVRFIFNGQDLRNDSRTLQAYNICDNSVVHCLITQPRTDSTQARVQQDDNGLDIGLLMYPLFGILLGVMWYLRFSYKQFFNVTSTLTLAGITFLYLAALLASCRRNRVHEHID